MTSVVEIRRAMGYAAGFGSAAGRSPRHHNVHAMKVRVPESTEIDRLASLWYDAWQDSHAHLVPPELRALRTFESFRRRLEAAIGNTRVIGPPDAPVGLCVVKGDELHQLFVAAEARGSGVAAVLLADAEARLAANGIRTAWLACAIGNDRAARFYEKCGWRRIGTLVYEAQIPSGTFPLEVWRYEKTLASGSLREPGVR